MLGLEHPLCHAAPCAAGRRAVLRGEGGGARYIVIEAELRISRRALRNRAMVAVAIAAFIAIFLFKAPFPAIVLGAGLLGWLGNATSGRAGSATGWATVRRGRRPSG